MNPATGGEQSGALLLRRAGFEDGLTDPVLCVRNLLNKYDFDANPDPPVEKTHLTERGATFVKG